MQFDPHFTLIRTAPEGAPVYRETMRRIAERREPPPTPMIHFAGIRGRNREFVVGTAFETPADMMRMFAEYTTTESTSVMLDEHSPVDISREEHSLEHLYIEEGLPSHGFGFRSAGTVAACTSEVVGPSHLNYWKVVDELGWFEKPVPGRIAHIAYRVGDAVNAIGLWESQEIGHQWYQENLVERFEELEPGKIDDETIADSWISLDSFVITVPQGDANRNFVRSRSDRSEV